MSKLLSCEIHHQLLHQQSVAMVQQLAQHHQLRAGVGSIVLLLPPVVTSFHGVCTPPSRPRMLFPLLALQSPKGFGPKPPPPSLPARPEFPSSRPLPPSPEPDDQDEEVPQIVTDRMIRRIAFTVGIPLTLGVLFFPFFYYLKVVLKLDVPEWLPLLVSGLLFGSSALGISYGILSASWDPLREGSLLGWKEAQANWPVLMKGTQGKQRRK